MTNCTPSPYFTLVTPPATEPVTLEEVKHALRIDGDDDDSFLNRLISVARDAAEKFTHRSLITQVWQLQYDQYMPSTVLLPKGPLQSIESVKTFDYEWNESTVNENSYNLSKPREAIVFDAIPIGMVVQVRYVTGYGDAEDVPPSIKQGIICHIANMYENRIYGCAIPDEVQQIYSPYIIMKV